MIPFYYFFGSIGHILKGAPLKSTKIENIIPTGALRDSESIFVQTYFDKVFINKYTSINVTHDVQAGRSDLGSYNLTLLSITTIGIIL